MSGCVGSFAHLAVLGALFVQLRQPEWTRLRVEMAVGMKMSGPLRGFFSNLSATLVYMVTCA